MSGFAGRIVFGFIAAALAVLTVHQGIIWLLGPGFGQINWLPAAAVAWSTKAFGPLNVPVIVNSMFWGGLWGVLYGLIHEKLPGGITPVKGILFGLAIVVLSNWIVLPLIKAQPMFAGGDIKRLMASALILSGFGLATALFYGLLGRR